MEDQGYEIICASSHHPEEPETIFQTLCEKHSLFPTLHGSSPSSAFLRVLALRPGCYEELHPKLVTFATGLCEKQYPGPETFSHCRTLEGAAGAAQLPAAGSGQRGDAGSAWASGGGLTRVTLSGPIPARAPATGPNSRRAWRDSDSNAGGNADTPAAPPSPRAVVFGGRGQVFTAHRTGCAPTDPPAGPRTDYGRRREQPPVPPAAPWDRVRRATEELSDGCAENCRRGHSGRRSALSVVCFRMRA